MKVIGISTSPRKDSNGKIALETALEAASAKGADTELIDAQKLTISPCQADDYCKTHGGKCAIQDDMQNIYKAIEEADGIIIATPIYFTDVTAQAKIIIDRLYAYFMSEEHKNLFASKKVAFITTNGVAPVEAFEASVKTQLGAFEMLGFQTVGFEALTDDNVPGAVKDKEDQLALAKKVGESVL